MPTRSLRVIFSASSACCSTCAGSKLSSDMPPVFSLSLWQPKQYCLINAVCDSADNVLAVLAPSFVAGPDVCATAIAGAAVGAGPRCA